MGLNISLSIVLGARALSVFPSGFREESRQISTVNELGEPTGEIKTLTELYLDSPNGSFLAGSNRASFSDRYASKKPEACLSSLFGNDSNEWIHFSDPESNNLEQFVIGLEIPGVKLEVAGNDFHYRASNLLPEERIPILVATELHSRFGYTGEISPIAIATYSY